MDAELDAGLRPPRDAEELDPVTELLRVADVLARELRDALGVDLVELHRDAEGNRRHDRELVRGVDALDVERRIGLGVAARLRALERGGERLALAAHLREDKVRRAVDDPGDPFDPVGGQALAQRLDDRDAATDRALERDHHALRVRGGEDLVAVAREQRLVCGNHMLAVGNRLQDERPRRLDPADELNDDVDVGMREDRRRIARHAHTGGASHELARSLRRLVGDLRDADRPPGTPRDLLGVARKHGPRPEPDRADPEQADLERLDRTVRHQSSPSLRNMSLIPRTACRVRFSFSIIAKRT
jgi:hypothetical protein